MAKTSHIRNNDLKAFGENLRKVRISKGISQEVLAEKTGIAYSTINKLENGTLNSKIKTLFELAKGLDVHIKELFNY